MPNFTPQELEEILQQFFDVTGKRQYVGARYVPIFGRKDESSIEWDNSKPYEPLTIVLYQGNSYTSRTYVPVGVDIDDTYFWANTGNYNAQVELYRRETAAVQQDLDTVKALIPSAAFTDENTVKDYIDNAISNVSEAIDDVSSLLPNTSFSDINTVKSYIDNNDKKRALVFATVADMKESDSIFLGATCRTNGYYNSGDGGSAYYVITDDGTSDNGFVIACNNGLFAVLVPDAVFCMKSLYGMAVNNGVYYDWTDAIQAAIDKLSGACDIFFDEDTYYVSDTLVCKNNTTLVGASQETSVIKLVPNSNCDMIEVGVIGQTCSTLIDNLCLYGDFEYEYGVSPVTHSTSGNGIVIRQNSYDGDGICIRNCYIRNFAENGIHINNYVFITSIENCTIKRNRYNGIYNEGTDNFFTNLRLYMNGLSGLKSYRTGANKYVNIKAYYNCSINGLGADDLNASSSTYNAGIMIRNCMREELINIECQDNYFTGFSANACHGCHVTGTLDDNGFGKTALTASGIYEIGIQSCTNCKINMSISENDDGYIEHMINLYVCKKIDFEYQRALNENDGASDSHVTGSLIYTSGANENITIYQSHQVLSAIRTHTTCTLSFNSTKTASATVQMDSSTMPLFVTLNSYTSLNISLYYTISGDTIYVNGYIPFDYTGDLTVQVDIYKKEI